MRRGSLSGGLRTRCGIASFVVAVTVILGGATGNAALTVSAASGVPQKAVILAPLTGSISSDPVYTPDELPKPGPHHRVYGGLMGYGGSDWAADIAAGSRNSHPDVYARFKSAGALTLTLRSYPSACAKPSEDGGHLVIVTVTVDGVEVGKVAYAHLDDVHADGAISNGDKIGVVHWQAKPNGCWGGSHVHVEPANKKAYSCFTAAVRIPNTVNSTTALGVVGGDYAHGVNTQCPAGATDLATPDPVAALRAAAVNKIVTVTATNTSYLYDGSHLHWIPDVETYWCLRNVQHRAVVTATQAQADLLGNGQPWVSPCFDPQRVINHIVREKTSGQAYYVTSGGSLAAQPTLWHPINDSATYNCLANSGIGVIQSNWAQINSLRGANGRNQGPEAICSTGNGAPIITSIPDITIGHNDSGSYPARLNYRDDDCDIVGGTWIDPSGVSHDFGNGTDASHAAACTGGIGYLTPGYGSCTSPDGVHSNPGRYAQTITIRDKLGQVSAPFVFYIVCE